MVLINTFIPSTTHPPSDRATENDKNKKNKQTTTIRRSSDRRKRNRTNKLFLLPSETAIQITLHKPVPAVARGSCFCPPSPTEHSRGTFTKVASTISEGRSESKVNTFHRRFAEGSVAPGPAKCPHSNNGHLYKKPCDVSPRPFRAQWRQSYDGARAYCQLRAAGGRDISEEPACSASGCVVPTGGNAGLLWFTARLRCRAYSSYFARLQ